MTFQSINIGSLANDGSGDPLRVAFGKVNNNFAELYSAAVLTTSVASTGNTISQIVYQVAANTFTQGTFQINSQQVGANNSQNVTLNVARNSGSNTVNHTAYSTLFSGNVIVSAYDVTISTTTGNLQIALTPDSANLSNTSSLLHTVAYRAS